MIYRKQQIIGGSLVGADAKLSYMGLFSVVEDAISEGMGMLRLDGVTVMRDYNAFWVFTKNKIKIFGSVDWGETVTVENFVSSVSSAKMVLDTAIKKSDGSIVAYSACEMCLLDIATGRIRRTSSVGIGENFEVEQSLCEICFDKIEDLDLPQADAVKVRSTNIDLCKHCNNVEYMRFLFNTYNVAQLTNLCAKEVEVCYMAQSFEGDELTVHKKSLPDREILSVRRNGSTVIKCCIVK